MGQLEREDFLGYFRGLMCTALEKEQSFGAQMLIRASADKEANPHSEYLVILLSFPGNTFLFVLLVQDSRKVFDSHW